jgi:DNA-binding NarL/FixJ family response regulator
MSIPNQTTVIIADDHPIFRKGLRHIIDSSSRFRVVGEADDGAAAWDLIRKEMPGVAILDIEMPNLGGLEVARKVQKDNLPVSILILTMYQDEDVFNEAMEAGAMGYILKDSAILEIIRGLTKVADGEVFVSSAMTSVALRGKSEARPQQRERLGLQLLTQAERRVLRLIAEERTSKEIAEVLNISLRTVENHRSHICAKLRITGVHALITFAVKYRSLLD